MSTAPIASLLKSIHSPTSFWILVKQHDASVFNVFQTIGERVVKVERSLDVSSQRFYHSFGERTPYASKEFKRQLSASFFCLPLSFTI